VLLIIAPKESGSSSIAALQISCRQPARRSHPEYLAVHYAERNSGTLIARPTPGNSRAAIQDGEQMRRFSRSDWRSRISKSTSGRHYRKLHAQQRISNFKISAQSGRGGGWQCCER